ncbi:hypothetical protein BaRGS_00000284 [Batillaria attramentaria]|uniref:ATP synthase F(0) complex subunit e, mitochondrial n=1 Tax=Batillaria attramentaria TaxID=370345 RepID=A0ABD0MA11_9CAEN
MASLPKLTLGPAREVSAIIRFGRYAALISGFIFGSYKLRALKVQEHDIQAHENKIRAVRDAKIKAERDAYVKAEMDALGREAGIIKDVEEVQEED